MIADTHVHLNDEKYNEILLDVLDRAVSNNISLMYIVGFDKDSSLKALELCEKYATRP